jgi:hypothetical protein
VADNGFSNDASRALAQDWLDDVTGRQAEILSDLVVTEDEYAAALEAARDCLHEAGYTTTPPTVTPDGIRSAYAVFPPAGGESSSEQGDRCWYEHGEAAESVWLAQHQKPAADHQALTEQYMNCLAELEVTGVTGEMEDWEIATALDAQGAPMEAWVCREQYLIWTGVVGARPPD